jgi:hypothetical protein
MEQHGPPQFGKSGKPLPARGGLPRLVLDRVAQPTHDDQEFGRVKDVRHGSTAPTSQGREEIRDQDVTGWSRNGRDGCDVDALASATNGHGGDAPEGVRPGSPCSWPAGRRFKSA